jgi:hypothetical protein
MMKEPIEGDFDVKVQGANVEITFNPTSGRLFQEYPRRSERKAPPDDYHITGR